MPTCLATASTCKRSVHFDKDAMLTYHYRTCHQSEMSSREYWGSGPQVAKKLDPGGIIKVSEARARRTAKELYKEVYASANGTTSSASSLATHQCMQDLSCSNTLVSAQSQITVGNDCSGMEVPIMALNNLGVKYRHQFSCDNDPISKEFIMKNFATEQFFDDIRHRHDRDA